MRESLVRMLEEKLDPNDIHKLNLGSRVAKKPLILSDDESEVDDAKL